MSAYPPPPGSNYNQYPPPPRQQYEGGQGYNSPGPQVSLPVRDTEQESYNTDRLPRPHTPNTNQLERTNIGTLRAIPACNWTSTTMTTVTTNVVTRVLSLPVSIATMHRTTHPVQSTNMRNDPVLEDLAVHVGQGGSANIPEKGLDRVVRSIMAAVTTRVPKRLVRQ
jgi:hypothetical protein